MLERRRERERKRKSYFWWFLPFLPFPFNVFFYLFLFFTLPHASPPLNERREDARKQEREKGKVGVAFGFTFHFWRFLPCQGKGKIANFWWFLPCHMPLLTLQAS